MCLGYRFALEEAKVALIRVYKRFTFRLQSCTLKNGDLDLGMGVTLGPRFPIWGRFVAANNEAQILSFIK